MGDEISDIDRAVTTLNRLAGQLAQARAGSRSARDDLAVTLHLLAGEGAGYGVLRRAWEQLGSDEPQVPIWSSDRVPSVIDARPESPGTTPQGTAMP